MARYKRHSAWDTATNTAFGEARERIGHASRVLDMLQRSVRQDSDLSVTSKRLVQKYTQHNRHKSIVLGVLLYGF